MNQKPLSLVEAKPFLEPFIPDILDAFWEAERRVDDLLANDPLSAFTYDSSTKASMLSNAFAQSVRPRMAARNVSWQVHRKFQSGVIQSAIRLRFKKLTPDLHSMNIRTGAQDQIYRQQPLPDANPLTQVTCGYTISEIDLRTNGIYFVCPNGYRSNLWTWAIYQEGVGGLSLFDGVPDADLGGDVAERRFEIKLGRKKQA